MSKAEQQSLQFSIVHGLKRYHVLEAIDYLLTQAEEFTQLDLHAYLEDMLGRPLTLNEKRKATLIARKRLIVKEEKIDRDTKIRIYIYML